MGRKIERVVSLEVFLWDELSTEEQHLVSEAKKATDNAYAPYSRFLVGSALLLDNGEILMGNNQENASYPVGICAERVVLGYSHARYPECKPLKIAIVAKRRDEARFATVTPCGLCRQTISEYEQRYDHPIEIFMMTPNGEILKASSIDDLLPFKFHDLNG